jgi:hypothetical protein
MKKINILMVVILSLIGVTSCTDTRGPSISSSALNGSLTFKLNQPQYSNMTYMLSDANADLDMDSLTCVQPAYGFTAAVTYTTQVSFGSTFATGTYQNLPTTISGEKVRVNTKEMDKAIIALYGGVLPTPLVTKDVFIRLQAFISDASTTAISKDTIVKPLYSNAITLKILPYVLPLFPYTEITPRLWFIVGLGNHWDNSVAGLGSSLIPLNLTAGKQYNLNGDGAFTYTGYFKASESFKLVRDYTSTTAQWAEYWGETGGVYLHNSGDNIAITADGFYTLTLNTIDNTLTIVPATVTATTNTSMGMMGDFNGWTTEIPFTASLGTNNHVWYTTYTFTSDYAAGGGCKFRSNGSWNVAWGGTTFPYGIGTSSNGANILFKAGTYVIIFNDLDATVATTGTYYFIKK